MCGPTMAAKSSSQRPVSREFILGMIHIPVFPSVSKWSATTCLACDLSSHATESSISGTKASGENEAALASMFGWLPGTNSKLLR